MNLVGSRIDPRHHPHNLALERLTRPGGKRLSAHQGDIVVAAANACCQRQTQRECQYRTIASIHLSS